MKRAAIPLISAWVLFSWVWAIEKPIVEYEIRDLALGTKENAFDVIVFLNLKKKDSHDGEIPHQVQVLNHPTRLVIDFYNTRLRVRRLPKWDRAGTRLQDIRLAMQENCQPRCVARLVLELQGSPAEWKHTTRQDKDKFLVQVQWSRPRPPEPAPRTPGPDDPNALIPPTMLSLAQEYRLGPGDQIEVQIFELPNFSMTLRVAPDGTISVVPIGRIQVAGLTVREEEALLQKRLQEGYIQDPHVSVNIKEFESQRYTVMGAVKNPGTFLLYTGKTVLTGLAEAGGLIEGAGPLAYLYRLNERGQYQRYEIDLERLVHQGDITQDVLLAPGDILLVPLGDVRVYVYGAVNRPGAVRGFRPFTLLQAIAAAGGPAERASLGGVRVIRANGKVERVDVGDILKGKRRDVELNDGDVVFVPKSLF